MVSVTATNSLSLSPLSLSLSLSLSEGEITLDRITQPENVSIPLNVLKFYFREIYTGSTIFFNRAQQVTRLPHLP